MKIILIIKVQREEQSFLKKGMNLLCSFVGWGEEPKMKERNIVSGVFEN